MFLPTLMLLASTALALPAAIPQPGKTSSFVIEPEQNTDHT
jgi:hypothetical protein